jgi:hypothetical protein
MISPSIKRALSICAGSVLLASCASAMSPLTAPAVTVTNAVAMRGSSVPQCKGQQNSSTHASVKQKFSTTGGTLCVPAFGGWGGTIQYPAAKPPVTLTLTSSTTNWNNLMPPLHAGKPLFYVALALSGPTTFGTGSVSGGGVVSAALVPKKPYTIYGEALFGTFRAALKPCYAIATATPSGGQLAGLGALLQKQNVPERATGVVEVYAGKSSGVKCS